MRLIDADDLRVHISELMLVYGDTELDCEILNAIDNAPTVERPIRCKDCKHQTKNWHEDKRMKEGGYWVYNCDFIADPFVSASVSGEPEEYCSSAEQKGGAE